MLHISVNSLTLNMLTQTGADQEPQDGPRRLIFIVGFFFCLVSFNYFSANIISSLQQIKGFNTLDEVVSVPEMTLSIPTFANWRNVLHSSPRTEAAKMVQRSPKLLSQKLGLIDKLCLKC